MNRLAGWVDCEIVACRKVLKAVFNQREVVLTQQTITLKQLCLLLVLVHEVLGVVMFCANAGLHEALHLVPVAFIWHHEVERISQIRDQRHVMVTNQVRLLQSLVLIVVAIRVLEVGVEAHRVLGWSGERLPVMVGR